MITGWSVLRGSVGAYRRYRWGARRSWLAVAALVVATLALLRISIPLGLLILLGTPPLLYLVHLFGKPRERRSGPEQERAAQASWVAARPASWPRHNRAHHQPGAACRH